MDFSTRGLWRVQVVDDLPAEVIIDVHPDTGELVIKLRRGLAVERALDILADLFRPVGAQGEASEIGCGYVLGCVAHAESHLVEPRLSEAS